MGWWFAMSASNSAAFHKVLPKGMCHSVSFLILMCICWNVTLNYCKYHLLPFWLEWKLPKCSLSCYCPAKIKVRGRCEVPCLLTSGGNIISFSYSPRVAGSCGTSSCCSGVEIRVLQCCGTFMCYKNLCTTPVALWSCMEMLSPFQNKFSTGMWIFPASHCILGPQSILW